MKDYYPIKILRHEKVYFCIWYTNDVDGILLEKNKIKSFSNYDNLKNYCEENKIKIKEDISTYNLDEVLEWLSSRKQEVDCKIILDLWNLISDLAKSSDEYFYGDDDETLHISEKLFYGNNLPAINRDGPEYYPKWDDDEYMIIKKVIQNGVELFNKYLYE
ncbi:hypothetical protein [[Clostridium] hylemonae]|uniref:hypothetical protein n=1 Tax=[Clostridium] hylemonae TaxID=89153 RepID=UPI001FCA6388|nr:hypothetical protein [[Clostridium] hylemonae]BDF04422.1 hypothetical protein CE91St63_14840 [[Clostridium] hylemonae]